MQTPFGKTLGILLHNRGWSQQKLSQATGVTPSFVSRLLSGRRRPTVDTVAAIADALALRPVSRARLFLAAGYAPEGYKNTVLRESTSYSEAAELVEDTIRRLSPSNRQDFRRAITALCRGFAAE